MDKVEDSRDISGTSRFLSGGVGGITSQLSKFSFLLLSLAISLINIGRYLSR